MPQMSSPTLELARVRAEIRRLKLREAVLRADVMDDARERRAANAAEGGHPAPDAGAAGHAAGEQDDEAAAGEPAGAPTVSLRVLRIGAFAPARVDRADMPSMVPPLPWRRGTG